MKDEYILKPFLDWWFDNENTISMFLGIFVLGIIIGCALGFRLSE